MSNRVEKYTTTLLTIYFSRLSHTFRLVQNFHWIVVEDAVKPSPLVADLLKYSTLNYTHLVAPTPASWKRKLKVRSCLGTFV